MELSPQEIEKAKFVFSIYDFDGKEQIDAFNLGDCLRALDLTPSLKTLGKLGQAQKKNEKKYSIEEFLSIYNDAKKDKDVGCLADYIEILKCYDKDNDGTMPANQLQHMLLATGERMDNESVQIIMDDCCEEPDEDGYINYVPFITKVCAGPVSTFDDVSFSLSAPAPTPAGPNPRIRPSITIADEDTPSVSFAAAKPMKMPEEQSEEPPVASFTLKAPRKSIAPPEA